MEICDGQGFPFSPLQCSQGRTRMGGGVAQGESVLFIGTQFSILYTSM